MRLLLEMFCELSSDMSSLQDPLAAQFTRSSPCKAQWGGRAIVALMRTPPTGHAPVSREETIASLLAASQRRRVPLRRVFVQKGAQNKPKPGALASFVKRHDRLGLDLYLLAVAAATHEPFEVRYGAGVWARGVGLTRGVASISRAWKRIAALKLITRGRKGRKANVRLLNEDGSGAAYTPPGLVKGDVYMQIPLAYWLEGHHASLSLPAKGMLLIGLTLPDNFVLPAERMKVWYGLSADTADRGLRELVQKGLMGRRPEWKRAPLTDSGFTKQYRYNLRAPYRRKKGKATRNERGTRQKGE